MAENQGGRIGEARQHDAGHVGLQVADLFQQLDAGHLRHALVGDDDVEIGSLGDLQRIGAGLRFLDAVTRFEEVAKDGEVGPLIVDDQDPAAAGLADAM